MSAEVFSSKAKSCWTIIIWGKAGENKVTNEVDVCTIEYVEKEAETNKEEDPGQKLLCTDKQTLMVNGQ
jgi:hypothetical protein